MMETGLTRADFVSVVFGGVELEPCFQRFSIAIHLHVQTILGVVLFGGFDFSKSERISQLLFCWAFLTKPSSC